MSEMSNSLTSLIKKEEMSENEQFANFFDLKKKHKENIVNQDFRFFLPKCFERIAHLLISSEPPEQIVHGRSFLERDLCDLLKVAYLS